MPTFVAFTKSIMASSAQPFHANSSNTPGVPKKPTATTGFTFAHISDDSYQTFVGVTLSLLGSFCFIIGWKYMHDANIQKKEAAKNPELERKADKKWYSAVAMTILAGLLDAGAFAFAAQSIINSLCGISVILYALVIPCWNERELEHLRATKFAAFYGCIVIVIGATMCVMAGDHRATAHSTLELELFFAEPSFLLFETITLLILGYFVLIHVFYRHVSNRKEITDLFLLGYGPAWLGAIMNMMLKAAMEILKSSLRGESKFISVETFLSITVTILLAVAQILFVNRGLKKFEHRTIKFIGFYQAIMMLLGVITGGIFYGEFDMFTPGRWWVFSIGAFFAIWGLLILAFVDKPRTHAVDMPTRKHCCCYSRFVCGIADAIIVEYPDGDTREIRKKAFLSSYDDAL
jgi:hypothetical protein